MPHPTALIADVKGSRQIENWPEVFGVLKKTLRDANKRFADQILVKFAPTVGDEFQGALKSSEKAYDVYTFIKASLPVPIYCGLGVGEVEITANGSAGLRGTAFYRAREALEVCKQKQGFLRVRLDDAMGLTQKTLEVTLHLLEALERQWTPRQRELVQWALLYPQWTQEELAAQLRVSQPDVAKIHRAAHFGPYREGMELARNLITQPQSS
jgi:hypothetical protein